MSLLSLFLSIFTYDLCNVHAFSDSSTTDVAAINFHHPAPWAQHLTPLWQGQPINIEAERVYNRAMSHRPPHCAICSFFKRFDVNKRQRLINSLLK